jgi:hypothetical protein
MTRNTRRRRRSPKPDFTRRLVAGSAAATILSLVPQVGSWVGSLSSSPGEGSTYIINNAASVDLDAQSAIFAAADRSHAAHLPSSTDPPFSIAVSNPRQAPGSFEATMVMARQYRSLSARHAPQAGHQGSHQRTIICGSEAQL